MIALKFSSAALALTLSGMTLWLPPVPASAPSNVPHFELSRSVPAADSTVHVAPTELRLWFTEAPQGGTTAVRVITADEESVPTGDVAVDSNDATSFRLPFTTPLSAGQYKVVWRAMGPDGHVVTGEFGFGVMIMAESP